MMTLSRSTDRKPLSMVAVLVPPADLIRTSPSTRTPSSGVWPGRMPSSPSTVRACTMSASPSQTLRSAATSSTCRVLTGSSVGTARVVRPSHCIRPVPGTGGRCAVGPAEWPAPRISLCCGSEVLLDVGPLALDVVEATAHEERLLGDVVVLAVRDLGERLDRVGQRHGRALDAGELLGDVGVLRQEPLDATGPVDEDLVLLGELVDAEDRDDVLQLLVALEDLLDPDRGVVVLGRDVAAVEDSRRRGQRVHGRVDAERGDLTRELGGRVEVRERRGRGRVGVVVQDRKSTR